MTTTKHTCTLGTWCCVLLLIVGWITTIVAFVLYIRGLKVRRFCQLDSDKNILRVYCYCRESGEYSCLIAWLKKIDKVKIFRNFLIVGWITTIVAFVLYIRGLKVRFRLVDKKVLSHTLCNWQYTVVKKSGKQNTVLLWHI